MTTSITNNTALWGTHPYSAEYYLYLDNPPTVFGGTVSGGVSDPLATFQYSGPIGTGGDIQIGQTIRWQDSAGSLKGYARVRRPLTAFFPNVMFINETSELDPQVGDTFLVVDEYRLWARIPRIKEDGTSYKDYDQLYAGQTSQWRPLANAGPYFVGTVNPSTGSVVVPFDGRMSYANSGAISSYSWDFVDGSPSSSSSATPTATFPAGRRWVSLIVTDSNGNAEINRSLVVAVDGATTSFTPASISNITLDRNEGATAEVEVLDTITPIRGGVALIYGVDRYNGTVGVVGGITGRETTKFMGYVAEDDVTIEPFNSTLRLRLIGPLLRMRQLVGFPQYLEYAATASEWTNANPLNAWLVLWYLLKYHTTAPDMLPVEAWQSGSAYTLGAWSDDDLNTQIDNMSAGVNVLPTCDRSGVLMFRRDPSWATNTVRSSLTTLAALTNQNWVGDLRITQAAYNKVAWLEASGIAVGNVIEPTPLLAVAYGAAPSDTGAIQRFDRLLPQTQSELNEWAGAKMAYLNRAIERVDLTVLNGGMLVDPAWQQQVTLTSTASNKANFSISNEPFFVQRVSIAIDPLNHVASEQWTLEPIEDYFAASTQDYVGNLPNQQYTAQPPPDASVNPPVLPPTIPDTEPDTPPSAGVAVAWGDDAAYTTLRTAPEWLNISITGDAQSIVFDEFSDYADDGDGDLGLYVLTDNNVGYIDDLLTSPTPNGSIAVDTSWIMRLNRGAEGAVNTYGLRYIGGGGTVSDWSYGFGTSEIGTVTYITRSGGTGTVGTPGNPAPAAQARVSSTSNIDAQFFVNGIGTYDDVKLLNWQFYTDKPSTTIGFGGNPIGSYSIIANLLTVPGVYNASGTFQVVNKNYWITSATWLEYSEPLANSFSTGGTYDSVIGVGFTWGKTVVAGVSRPNTLAIDNIAFNATVALDGTVQGFHYVTGPVSAVASRTISTATTVAYGGMDTDDFNNGIVVAVGNNGTNDAIYVSDSYFGGSFVESSFASHGTANFNIVRLPYREFGDQSLNDSTSAFDVLIGADGTIPTLGTASLWQVSFNNAGTVNGTIDITPIISGTTYVVASGYGEQIESLASNSAVMLGNFAIVGSPSVKAQLLTEDAGSTWAVVGTYDAEFVRWADVGNQAAWVAGADGIYYTEDRGDTWLDRTGDYAGTIESLSNLRGAYGIR